MLGKGRARLGFTRQGLTSWKVLGPLMGAEDREDSSPQPKSWPSRHALQGRERRPREGAQAGATLPLPVRGREAPSAPASQDRTWRRWEPCSRGPTSGDRWKRGGSLAGSRVAGGLQHYLGSC